MELEDAMRDVVRGRGGRVSEAEYVAGILDALHADGKETKEQSVRSNAFQAGRMAKAGVTRVTIGPAQSPDSVKQVWTIAAADAMLTGSGNFSQSGSGQTTIVNNGGQIWMGIEVANIEDYDEATASRVPPHSPGFVESPEQEIEALADAWISGEHTMLEGPKGCGKTILVAQFCFHTQLPMWRFNCSEGITEDDLVGFNTAVNGNTVWMDGIIPRWARNGGILFADEFNGASPSVMLWMHMAMDSATIVLPTGEKIDLHPSCRVVAAINPPEDYAGLEELNEATRDRYAMGLTMTYLPSNKEMTVIMDQSGNADSALAREIIALAGDLRRMKSDNTLNRDCSTRTLVQVMRLSLRQSQTRSIERALISKYDRHHREKVRTTCRARLSAFGLVE
jgi:nitric oxide reductase NorQ protein